MNISGLLDVFKLYARIDGIEDFDPELPLLLKTAAQDVAHAANYVLPEAADDLPDDLKLAIIDHAAMMFDARGGNTERHVGLSLAAANIVARYRGVSV